MRGQLCMPPQQISPSAASRSPKSSAMVQASRKVSAMRLVLPAGSLAHSAGPAAESMRTMPYLRMPRSRSLRPMRQAFSHLRQEAAALVLAAHGRSAAGGRPDGRHQRSRRASLAHASLSARRFRSSSEESISVCGRERNRSTPSNRHAVHFGGGSQIQHGIQIDGRLGIGTFADQCPATWRCEARVLCVWMCSWCSSFSNVPPQRLRVGIAGAEVLQNNQGIRGAWFSMRIPACAALAVTKSSSSVSWPKRIMEGVETGTVPNVPYPCVRINP